ncbi:hypothetical protein [Priestia aryabhattai]|uniref:hypothetical protein n=1 Tax=Priestia aryabhattai TaxID=412384 RepID=UPI001C8E8C77|nr:hypothetical protein [Priestia aryabhattai]MBX9988116.1 hypothetical protein [Priestia aryabhattai]MBY0001509.1 hypothetical protein [Priestia aryabhattai]
MDNNKSDNRLIHEYNEHLSHGRYGQAQKVGIILERRGYNVSTSGDDDLDYEESTSSFGLGFFSPGFFIFGVVLVFLALVVWQILTKLPPGIYTHAVIPFHEEFLLKLRPFFPVDEPYGAVSIKNKVMMPISLLFMSFVSVLLFGLLSICTLNLVRMRYLTTPFATFVLLSSFYVLYEEYPNGNASIYSVFMFFVTFVLCFLPIKKLKKNWKIGLYIMVLSTLAFLVIGNNLLAPYVCLCMGGSILLSSPGSFWRRDN